MNKINLVLAVALVCAMAPASAMNRTRLIVGGAAAVGATGIIVYEGLNAQHAKPSLESARLDRELGFSKIKAEARIEDYRQEREWQNKIWLAKIEHANRAKESTKVDDTHPKQVKGRCMAVIIGEDYAEMKRLNKN